MEIEWRSLGGNMRWLHVGGVERKQRMAVELGGRRYKWTRTRGGDFVRILGWAVEALKVYLLGRCGHHSRHERSIQREEFYYCVNSGLSIGNVLTSGRLFVGTGRYCVRTSQPCWQSWSWRYGRERVQPFHELHQTPRRSSLGACPQFSIFRAGWFGRRYLACLGCSAPTNLLPMQPSEAIEIHTESSIPSSHFFP
jgi:hypothetical protein